MRNPTHLILVGPMGAGKSELGRRLAAHYGVRFVDVDREIESRAGSSVSGIFARDGEPAFRALESAVLADCLRHREPSVVATGGGVVLTAANRAMIRACGLTVHLHIDVAAQLQRLAGDDSRPLLARPDREAALHALAAERAAFYAEVADLRMDTGGLDPDAAATQLVRQLDHCWPTHGATT